MSHLNMREGDNLQLEGPKITFRNNGVEEVYSFEAFVTVDNTGLFSLVARIKRNGEYHGEESLPVLFRTMHNVIQVSPYLSGGGLSSGSSYSCSNYMTSGNTAPLGGGQ